MFRGKSATLQVFNPVSAPSNWQQNERHFFGKTFNFFDDKIIKGIKVLIDVNPTWKGQALTCIDTPAEFAITLINKNNQVLIDNLSLASLYNENAKLGRPGFELKNIDWEASYIILTAASYTGVGSVIPFLFEFNPA